MEQIEVLLEVEHAPNNRPRSHVEDGVYMSTLKPYSLNEFSLIPEYDTDYIIDKDIRKRVPFIKSFKETVWSS